MSFHHLFLTHKAQTFKVLTQESLLTKNDQISSTMNYHL